MTCVGSEGGGTGSTSTNVNDIPNGIYCAIITVEAWVGQNTNVQINSNGINTNNTFMYAYQTGRNTIQHVSIVNITNGIFTIYLFHNDSVSEARAFNWRVTLVRIK